MRALHRRLAGLPASVLTVLALTSAGSAASAADLAEVYQKALRNDPQLREAEATRLAALEAKPQALALLLPQLSATGSATHGDYNDRGGDLYLSFGPRLLTA